VPDGSRLVEDLATLAGEPFWSTGQWASPEPQWGWPSATTLWVVAGGFRHSGDGFRGHLRAKPARIRRALGLTLCGMVFLTLGHGNQQLKHRYCVKRSFALVCSPPPQHRGQACPRTGIDEPTRQSGGAATSVKLCQELTLRSPVHLGCQEPDPAVRGRRSDAGLRLAAVTPEASYPHGHLVSLGCSSDWAFPRSVATHVPRVRNSGGRRHRSSVGSLNRSQSHSVVMN
jgi:hypothetical protein